MKSLVECPGGGSADGLTASHQEASPGKTNGTGWCCNDRGARLRHFPGSLFLGIVAERS